MQSGLDDLYDAMQSQQCKPSLSETNISVVRMGSSGSDPYPALYISETPVPRIMVVVFALLNNARPYTYVCILWNW